MAKMFFLIISCMNCKNLNTQIFYMNMLVRCQASVQHIQFDSLYIDLNSVNYIYNQCYNKVKIWPVQTWKGFMSSCFLFFKMLLFVWRIFSNSKAQLSTERTHFSFLNYDLKGKILNEFFNNLQQNRLSPLVLMTNQTVHILNNIY